MKKVIATLSLALIACASWSQQKDTWIAFWNTDTTLIGFKDQHGIVKIEPRFCCFTRAGKFDDIIGVTEQASDVPHSYYLTKKGRVVGRDSLYIIDNGADCESEGLICFRDRATDKAGMFNNNGDIAIPAIYNDLRCARNGLILALKGATKKAWGEHFSWVGGKTLLLDINGHVLIDSLTYKGHLNFFSLIISSKPSDDPLRKSFKGLNGKYYSFVDFDKEFKTWLSDSLLNNLTKENLLLYSHHDIYTWKDADGWGSGNKSGLIERNFSLIKTKLSAVQSKTSEYDIFDDGLNPYISPTPEYNIYFNNCGDSKDWIYPVKTVVISYKKDDDLVQDQFEFLRTASGYKLIGISIKNGELK